MTDEKFPLVTVILLGNLFLVDLHCLKLFGDTLTPKSIAKSHAILASNRYSPECSATGMGNFPFAN